MARNNVKYALLILVAAAVGYLCFLMAAPFLMAIAWAAVLAIIACALAILALGIVCRVRSFLLIVLFAFADGLGIGRRHQHHAHRAGVLHPAAQSSSRRSGERGAGSATPSPVAATRA